MRRNVHRVIAKTAVASGVTSCAAAVLAAPALAAPLDLNQYIEVPNCNVSEGTELCPQIPSVTVTPQKTRMEVTFTANPNHCSDIIAHILIDGREYASTRVGPGESDGGHVFGIGPGPHTIGVQAEGARGGCNTTGTLLAWGGNLHILAISNGIGVSPVIPVG